MKSYVTDTHSLLWAFTRPAKLGEKARKINYIPFGIGIIVLLALTCGILGINYIITHLPTINTPIPIIKVTPKPPTAPPTPKPGSTQVSEKDGMVMVYVPEGNLSMGSSNSGQSWQDT